MQTHPLVLEEVVAERSRSRWTEAEAHRRVAARRGRWAADGVGPGHRRHPALLRAVGSGLIALGRRLAGPEPALSGGGDLLLPGCRRA